jgi:hypothetical protein
VLIYIYLFKPSRLVFLVIVGIRSSPDYIIQPSLVLFIQRLRMMAGQAAGENGLERIYNC